MTAPITPPSSSVSSFTIEKFAPRRLGAGQPFEYILRVTNNGTDALEGAVLVEALISSISIDTCEPASQIPEPHMGRWSIGDIPPGEYREVHIHATSSQEMTFRSYSSLSFATHA